jgi:hypothetical protein
MLLDGCLWPKHPQLTEFNQFPTQSVNLIMKKGAKLLILVPGAGLEPARTLPGPRDFKSRVSTNSTIRALHRS